MKKYKSKYVCPETLLPLHEILDKNTKKIIRLKSEGGKSYNIENGILNLTFPENLHKKDKIAKDFYEGRASDYDKFLHLTFKTHNENEINVRNTFIDSLNINKGEKVLDIACGTGRDSEIIASRLGSNGEIFCQDISSDMLRHCKKRLEKFELKKYFSISNAVYLPFQDNYFDSVYSFGGIGEFSNIKRSLKEMVRVTKVGGKVVFGDESIPPWLKNSEFANILTTTNPQFLEKVPLKKIPIEARKVRLRWVIGGVFYLIDFKVGKGAPSGNFDFDIPGPKGGTYRTRYEGKLEGVKKEVKELAYKAIKKKGISMHEWLNNVVKQAANKDLK